MPRKQPGKVDGPAKGKTEEGEQPTKEEGEPKGGKALGPESRQSSLSARRHSKKPPADPHAAAIKTYSPFLNTVFGKVSLGHDGGSREAVWPNTLCWTGTKKAIS